MGVFKNLAGTLLNTFRIGGSTLRATGSGDYSLPVVAADSVLLAAADDASGAVRVSNGTTIVGALPGADVAISADADNALTVGNDGGLFVADRIVILTQDDYDLIVPAPDKVYIIIP